MRLGKRKQTPQDTYEIGAASYEPIPYGTPNLRGIPRLPIKLVLVVLLALLGWSILRSSQKVPLATSCTKADFALSTHSPRQNDPVKYSITGPDDGQYVLGIDVAKYVFEGTREISATPDPGKTQVQTIPKLHTLKSCKASGFFVVRVEPGVHAIKLFRIAGGNTELVTTQTLTVSAPKV